MEVNVKYLVLQTGALFLFLGLFLFISAGTIFWISGWIFLLLYFIFCIVISIWLACNNPGLLNERMTGRKNPGQAGWDRNIMWLNAAIFIVWLILMPIDAVRFHWSHLSVWIQAVGFVLLMCSFYLFYLTFRENPYLSPVVRIQKDRGHVLVSTGPYRYVRHPMYAAGAMYIIGTSLLLGSLYGNLPGLLLIAGIAVRAVLEEHMLLKELPGYEDYMSRVRYRFIPHVW